jgi:hypothetical protein
MDADLRRHDENHRSVPLYEVWYKLRQFAARYPCPLPHISRITAGASFGSMPRKRRNAS